MDTLGLLILNYCIIITIVVYHFAGCSTGHYCISSAEGAAWRNCVNGTGFSGELSNRHLSDAPFTHVRDTHTHTLIGTFTQMTVFRGLKLVCLRQGCYFCVKQYALECSRVPMGQTVNSQVSASPYTHTCTHNCWPAGFTILYMIGAVGGSLL